MKKERYDAQRKFSHDQKVQMGERQEFLCGGGCGRSFWRQPLSSAQAHHIIPFSLNGLTELPNGILLCSECHKKYDQMAIQEGRIYGGDYTLADAEPEQLRKGSKNK